MELAPARVSLSFEVTFDSPSLDVGMSVYDDSGEEPELVSGPSAMALVVGNTYRGKFTAADGKSYIIIKAVYTDDTFEELNSDYAAGSESIVTQVIGGDPPTENVVGYVDASEVVGLVNC